METRCLNLSIWNVCHLVDNSRVSTWPFSALLLCFLTILWEKLLLLYQFLKWGKWSHREVILPKDVYLVSGRLQNSRDISLSKFTMTSTIPIWKIILLKNFCIKRTSFKEFLYIFKCPGMFVYSVAQEENPMESEPLAILKRRRASRL